MAIKLKNADGSLRNATAIRIKNADGSLRYATMVRKKLASGSLVVVWQALAVAANDITSDAFAYEPAPSQRAFTGYASPTVTGSSSYTVSWVFVSGDGGTTCSNASTLNPAFQASVWSNSEENALWRITVTDNASGLTASDLVSIHFGYTTDR